MKYKKLKFENLLHLQTQYGQEMPHVHESSSLTEHPPKSSGPPILPPHLLQVILNKVSKTFNFTKIGISFLKRNCRTFFVSYLVI